MGYNTTAVILNDALAEIASDTAFGKKLSDAVRMRWAVKDFEPLPVSAGCHTNAVHIIETHHADFLVPVLVGGNIAKVVENVHLGYRDTEMKLLECLAKKHGYELRKRKR